MKIVPVPTQLFHADQQTDRHDASFGVLRKLLKILRSAHTVYLCVLCGYENKHRLFPYTALTDWFL